MNFRPQWYLDGTSIEPHCHLELRGLFEVFPRTQRGDSEDPKRTQRGGKEEKFRNSEVFPRTLLMKTCIRPRYTAIRPRFYLTPSQKTGCFRGEMANHPSFWRNPSQVLDNTVTFLKNGVRSDISLLHQSLSKKFSRRTDSL
jgi:hypothetical protein